MDRRDRMPELVEAVDHPFLELRIPVRPELREETEVFRFAGAQLQPTSDAMEHRQGEIQFAIQSLRERRGRASDLPGQSSHRKSGVPGDLLLERSSDVGPMVGML